MATTSSYVVTLKISYASAAARDTAYNYLKTQLTSTKASNPFISSNLSKEDRSSEDV